MKTMKIKIENAFQALALVVTGNPKKIIITLGLITLFGAFGLTRVQVDVSTDSFFLQSPHILIDFHI